MSLPPVFLADKSVRGFLRGVGINDFDLDAVRRSSVGDVLYLSSIYQTKASSSILIVKENGSIEKRSSDGKIVFFDDQQSIVAWINDFKQGVFFRNGERINGPIESFDMDYGGNYFIVRIPKGDTQIFRLADKNIELGTSALPAERIYQGKDRIYLFSRDYRESLPTIQSRVLCHIFTVTKDKAVFEKEIAISRPGGPSSSPFFVEDFDPSSNKALLVDVSDSPVAFLTTHYMFDINSNEMFALSKGQSHGVFLNKLLGARLK